jgi:thiol:disulfide interchange protein
MTNHRRSIRLPLLILILLALFAWLVFQPKPKDLIPWQTNYTAAMAESKKSGKPLLLYFTAKWCEGCQILEMTTWSDRSVARQLAKCVCVKLDSDDPATLPLAMQYQVMVIPRFVLLDKDGRTIRTANGAMPPEDFLDWLNGKQIPDETITGAN